jgi:hypothetical protein
MWKDPIVEDVRRAREAFAAKYNYDLDAIWKALKELERKDPRPKVTFAPKPPAEPRKAATEH